MMVEVFEPILVQIVGVGMMIEIMGRGVFNTIFIASILGEQLEHVEQ